MLKQLHFSEVLRYALSGAVLVAAYGISRFGFNEAKALIEPAENGIASIAAAILCGILIYSIHRTLFRGITRLTIGYLRLRQLVDSSFSWWRGFHESEFRRDYFRFKRDAKYPKLQKNLQIWGAQVHFLYCSAWSALIGGLIGHCYATQNLCTETKPATFYFVMIFSVLCLTFAFIQHCNLTYVDCRLCPPNSDASWKPNLEEDFNLSSRQKR